MRPQRIRNFIGLLTAALTLTQSIAYATSEPTTLGQQILDNKLEISLGIGGVILFFMVMAGIAQAMYKKAAQYGLEGFRCWQFALLAVFSVLAWIVCIVMYIREQPSQEIMEIFLMFLTPPFLIAAFSNVRRSNVVFGLGWTLLQLIQALLAGLVVAIVLIKLYEHAGKKR